MKLKVGFIYGGISTEHEISVISALQAMNNVDKEKYEIIPIYISKNGEFYTGKDLLKIENYKNLKKLCKKSNNVAIIKKGNEYCLLKVDFPHKILSTIDIFFPIVHGYNVEDGSIVGYLETIGAPYAESDLYASAVGQDKVIQKILFKENGIKVTPYIYFYENDFINNESDILKQVKDLTYPVIVKPARLGSSVGITIAKNENDVKNAIKEALKYDEKILVEKVVDNLKELNCSVLGDKDSYKASLIEEVTSSKDILSFEDKYLNGGKTKGMASADRIIPANISKNITKEIEEISLEACKLLNTCGIVRIDYLLDTKTNDVYLNEINIIPGSLSFYLWKDMSYKNLLTNIIELGIKKYKNKSRKQSSFESNVLQNFNGTKGVKK